MVNKKLVSFFFILALITNTLALPKINYAEENNENISLKEKYSVGKNTLKKMSISNEEEKKYVEGEVIIKYKNNKVGKLDNKINQLNQKGLKTGFKSDKLKIAFLKSKNSSTQDLINEIKNDSDIEFIQPNYIYKKQSFSPNDTDYQNLWGLNDDLGELFGTDTDIDWPEAMDLYNSNASKNSQVVVAVIDTGVNYNHKELKNQMWDGQNCKDENGNALGGCIHGYNFYNSTNDPLDDDGHGSHVSGTIAAEMNNSFGITGVNPNAKIMAVKGLGALGGTTIDLVKSIDFATQNNAKIINASWGGYFLEGEDCSNNATPNFDRSIYDAIKRFKDAGGLFVAAAGNFTKDHTNPNERMFPAGFGGDLKCGNVTLPGLDNIISVASIDSNGNLSSFSDYGSGYIDIGAPGSHIYSSYIDNIGYENIFNGLDYSISSTGNILPEYLTGEIGNWGVYDTLWPGQFLDIYPDYNVPYLTGQTYEVQSIDFDLSNSPGKDTYLSLAAECRLPETNSGSDYLSLSISKDGGLNYEEIKRFDSDGYDFNFYDFPISEDYKTKNFRFKFNWVSGNDNDAEVGCNFGQSISIYNTTTLTDQFAYEDGTSMATPHVAGIASLALSFKNDLSYSELKNKILKSGDRLESLSGVTTSGKKANAYNTLLSLTDIGTVKDLKIYDDSSKLAPISTGSTIGNPYLEWNDSVTNPYILNNYIINALDGSGTVVYSGSTHEKNANALLNKSGNYKFKVFKTLPDGSTGGVVETNYFNFNLNPNGVLSFISDYTNTGSLVTMIYANKELNYKVYGDINEELTGFLSAGANYFLVDLKKGDGIKNIKVDLKDDVLAKVTLTGSVILDETLPEIKNLSVLDNTITSNSSIILTGTIVDENKGSFSINGNNPVLETNGNFSSEETLQPGENNITLIAYDKAGNEAIKSLKITRIGKSPVVDVFNKFGEINFDINKELEGTGFLVYGTGELNNYLTGTYGHFDNFKIKALPKTTYNYKVYYLSNNIESSYLTGSIKSNDFLSGGSINGNIDKDGPISFSDATSSGISFNSSGSLNIKSYTDNSNFISLNLNGLQIKTKNGVWDGVINPPYKTVSSGSLNVSMYKRLDDLTFKAGSDRDSLEFLGNKAEVNINVGTTYNSKKLKVYRSGDNQQTFEYVDECNVINGVCKFSTSKFSHFTFLVKNASAGGSGGGGGGGGVSSGNQTKLSTCTKDQFECINGIVTIKKGQNCILENKNAICEKSTTSNTGIYLQTEIKKEKTEYKGFSYYKTNDSKINQVIKRIIENNKISETEKETFIEKINNYLDAKSNYENLKNDKNKALYQKHTILLSSNIKSILANLKSNKNIPSTSVKKIGTDKKIPQVK